MQPEAKYYKYLDSYRFIAVLLVILAHWLPAYLGQGFYGKLGVDMFFVLSGFLITEILLRQKKRIAADPSKSGGHILWSFYIRRALRIFPIYYLMVFLFLLLKAPEITGHFYYFLFYGVNYLLIHTDTWAGMFTHLWSLSVEEQFYLLWPLLIIFIPLLQIKKVLIGLIAASLLFIAWVVVFNNDFFERYNILSCFCVLCSGGLLAYCKFLNKPAARASVADHLIFWPGLICLALFAAGIFTNYFWLQMIIIIVSFVLLKMLLTRENRLLDLVMNNPFISFLGKISYGLYLYHFFVPWLLRNLAGTETAFKVMPRGILPEPKGFVAIFGSQFLLLLLIAAASWFLIEKPVNSLKRKFNYN